jgi:hypothetical protein
VRDFGYSVAGVERSAQKCKVGLIDSDKRGGGDLQATELCSSPYTVYSVYLNQPYPANPTPVC